MKRARLVLAAGILVAVSGAAMAADTPPDDVKIEDHKVMASLTGMAGDAKTGAKVFKDRKLGNCLACHANKAMQAELFHGEVGPALDGVADRWSAAELRAILVNSKAVFGAETVMPGFYTLKVGENVAKDFVGKTILSAQNVEDLVAYLTTLKE